MTDVERGDNEGEKSVGSFGGKKEMFKKDPQ